MCISEALGVWCVGVVLLTLVPLASSSAACPGHCTCSAAAINCTEQHVLSWATFLHNVPWDAHAFSIQGGMLKWEVLDHAPAAHQNLQSIHISHCHIVHFDPKVFQLTPNLRELHLEHLDLDDIEAFEFTSIPHLEALYLNQSNFAKVNNKSFQGLTDLRILNLSANLLTHISAHAFNDLTNLELLDLSFNQIEYIHPMAFSNLSNLQSVNVESNQLSWMQPSLLGNLSSLVNVHLSNNPWGCYCGIGWLAEQIRTSPEKFSGTSNITCHSPSHLSSRPLALMNHSNLICQSPTLEHMPDNDTTIGRLHDVVLSCNATGVPTPSVYWLTPHGVLAHPAHKHWISNLDQDTKSKLTFAGQPSFYKAEVEVAPNGDLHFRQFRLYFAGEYTCIAENPAGKSQYGVKVSIKVDFSKPILISIMYGGVMAGCVLFLGIIIGALRVCAERFCCPQAKGDGSLSVEVYSDDEWSEEEPSPGTEPFHPWHMPWMWSPTFSRNDSPKKCVTPAEGLGEEEAQQAEPSLHILEQLEDVRALLRHGMQRSMGRLRTSAQHVRESGSKRLTFVRESGSRKLQTVRETTSSKIQNVRESSSRRLQTVRESSSRRLQNIRSSSSQYISTIRESGSRRMRHFRSSTGQYMHRMRTGVSIGMESMKSNIQSIREFCGPGDITHTVSTYSVATDVDSQERSEVVKTITYL